MSSSRKNGRQCGEVRRVFSLARSSGGQAGYVRCRDVLWQDIVDASSVAALRFRSFLPTLKPVQSTSGQQPSFLDGRSWQCCAGRASARARSEPSDRQQCADRNTVLSLLQWRRLGSVGGCSCFHGPHHIRISYYRRSSLDTRPTWKCQCVHASRPKT